MHRFSSDTRLSFQKKKKPQFEDQKLPVSHSQIHCQPKLTSEAQFPDPKGWTSKLLDLEEVKHLLASRLGVPASSIGNILRDRAFPCEVFSYQNLVQPDLEVFYLFDIYDEEVYRIEKPETQRELWKALGEDNWFEQLVRLKEVFA